METIALRMLMTLLCLTLPALVAQDDDKSAELVGVYTIMSGEKFGVAEPKDKIQGDIVRFSRDRLVVIDKNSEEIYGASYKLDCSTKPWKITMTSKLASKENSVSECLVEKDGDTVKLIYALPGGKTPSSFKTGAKQLMFMMKYTGK